MRLLVLVNRSAGTADGDALATVLDVLRDGADAEVAATADLAQLDRAVAGRGDRRPVVAGGDGSVHAAVRALDRAGGLDPARTLGIVPLGTGNDLARALGLPLEPAAAARVVLDGVPRTLDLLRDDAGGLVVNAVHAGVGAQAGLQAERLKDALGVAAYPLGAAVAGVTSAGWRLRVTVDGAVVTSPAGWAADGDTGVLMAGVCNGRSIGGGTELAPDADPGDGLADVVVSTATGPAARAAFAAALVTGRHVGRDDVTVVRGREVTVAGDPVELDADGELQPAVGARTWRVEPAAWSVLVPR
jgi:diacylglycerol kinase family enzyme